MSAVEMAASAENNQKSYSRMDRWSYLMDNIVSSRKGQISLLFISCLTYVVVCGAVFMNVEMPGEDGEPMEGWDFTEAMWVSWTYMADPGTHSESPPTLVGRLVGFVITWGGIIFFAVIIGFVYDAIQEKMDALKKGKSNVVEEDHTLMLGWTSFSLSFILEICDANSSEGGGVIVVLTDQDKETVEREFYASVKRQHLCGTKVVFRTGSAMSKQDLTKVSAPTARAILILAQDEGDADKKDAVTLRTVLTLKGMESMRGHIVAELRDLDNERMVSLIGGDVIETVVSHDIIGRLLLLSARTPGLAKVYGDMLGFAGDEFYMSEWPTLTGVPFGDICTRMVDASPLAIKHMGADGRIQVIMNPDPTREMQEGEELVVLAEDDDTYEVGDDVSNELDVGELPTLQEPPKNLEDILIVGWRRDIRDMFLLLDSMVMQGSKVHLMAQVPLEDRYKLLLQSGLNPNALQNYTLLHHEGNPVARKNLEALPVEVYSSVIILADQTLELSIMDSDSATLATLLLVRDIQARREKEYALNGLKSPRRSMNTAGAKRGSMGGGSDPMSDSCPIICEILDTRTQKTIASNKCVVSVCACSPRHLTSYATVVLLPSALSSFVLPRYVNQTSEFIQSNQLISQALAMIAENRAVQKILGELLGAGGCDLCLRPSDRYCGGAEKVPFLALVKRAQRYREILIGYTDGVECFMNPKDKLEPKRWEGMMMVVLVQGAKTKDDGEERTDLNEGDKAQEFDAAYTDRCVNARVLQIVRGCVSANGLLWALSPVPSVHRCGFRCQRVFGGMFGGLFGFLTCVCSCRFNGLNERLDTLCSNMNRMSAVAQQFVGNGGAQVQNRSGVL
jgi:hypothetical protein